jgi:uncharacterized protein
VTLTAGAIMSLLAIIAIGYAAIVGVLYFAQTSLIFPGAGFPVDPIESPIAPERIEVETADGERLHGMLLRAGEDRPNLLIGFGGNAQNAELMAQDLAADFPEVDVAVFHYRGYGLSTGTPSEQALLADAVLVHDEVWERVQPEHTFAFGISLGSAVAAHLSRERPLSGVLMVSPFDSIEAVAREAYFWVPVSLLLQHRFPTSDYVADNWTPIAVIAADDDTIIRPRRTAALVRQIPNLVFERVIPNADHNTIYALPAYRDALQAAFDALHEAATAVPDV